MDEEIELIIENQVIKFNKKDLIDRSDYFRAMFEGNFVERDKSSITLEGVDLNSMNIILKLFWDETLEISQTDILKVLQTSCMLQFNDIKDNCIRSIIESLGPHNCLEVWFVAEALSLKFLHQKSKNLALIEFDTIKDSDCLLDLTLKQLYSYLGSIQLVCKCEMDVFNALVKWFNENGEKNDSIFVSLLSCIDFNHISKENIDSMLCAIPSNTNVKRILNYILQIRQKEIVSEHFQEIEVKIAQKCLESRERIKDLPVIYGYFDNISEETAKDVEVTSDSFKRKRKLIKLNNEQLKPRQRSLLIYDKKGGQFLKHINVPLPKHDNTIGYSVLGYKDQIFLFGGELGWGSGLWIYDFLVYDVTKEKWTNKTKLPFCRRNFQACICDSYLYILRGVETYRVIAKNMFYYKIVENTWSPAIILPCDFFECCNHNNQLFLMDLENKCGYLYDTSTNTFKPLKIYDDDRLVNNYPSQYTVFSYRNKIYVKGQSLIEFEMNDENLRVLSERDVGHLSMCDSLNSISSVVCGDTVYIAYYHNGIMKSNNTFEALSMSTFKVTVLSEHLPCDIKLFSMQQLCEYKEEKEVNDMEDFQINNTIMGINPTSPPMERHPKLHIGMNPLLMTMRNEIYYLKQITFAERRKKMFDLQVNDFLEEDKQLREVGLAYINEIN